MPRTTQLYTPGENLLSPQPVWVYVDGQFFFGMDHTPTRAEDGLIRAANPGRTVAYLNRRAPITLKFTDGTDGTDV